MALAKSCSFVCNLCARPPQRFWANSGRYTVQCRGTENVLKMKALVRALMGAVWDLIRLKMHSPNHQFEMLQPSPGLKYCSCLDFTIFSHLWVRLMEQGNQRLWVFFLLFPNRWPTAEILRALSVLKFMKVRSIDFSKTSKSHSQGTEEWFTSI